MLTPRYIEPKRCPRRKRQERAYIGAVRLAWLVVGAVFLQQVVP